MTDAFTLKLHTGFRLVSKLVTYRMTLNGLTTADVRYVCGS